jgi:dTDP-4-dehydrorhamnose reductase
MLRVLITGATGQLGCELGRVLAAEELCLWSRREVDITDPGIVDRIIALRPEVIIHTAAYTDVDGCERHPDLAYRTNALATQYVVQAAEQVRARVVYISTDYVFDGQKQTPYVESDAPNPLNVYGQSKLAGEQYVQQMASQYCILRTSWLYSRYGRNFVLTIARLARERAELHVVDDQRGCPTAVQDLAEAIRLLLTTAANGVYHAVGEGECTWHAFAQEIVRLQGLSTPVVPISSSQAQLLAQRPSYSVLHNRRLHALGIRLRPWREALKALLVERDANKALRYDA